eukprot:gnl/TRDRNA2_/TRDRNA2_138905_c0_seq1.p1 gnl/TRDRNA2_/TRDRNA2_138905_c0~~gnl/TRDRNA2_/TRDRNA2_138905_c0_seq1.p1  ORF type:complete len:519 (+),score=91.18 gnl/TRDRNA2_/TRDRNA2_138905_c0_seq1:114-1559(+)
MVWVMILLILMIYFFSIFCVDAIGLADYTSGPFPEEYPDGWPEQYQYFGTMSNAMLTLFSVAILTEWAEVVRPVWAFQPYFVLVFVIFVLFTTLGILNVIVGVIVERTSEAAKQETDKEVRQKHELQMLHVKNLCDVMTELDDNCDGLITLHEITNEENADVLKGILDTLDLPAGWSAKELHMMLDEDGAGVLSSAEFLEGMFRLVFSSDFHRVCLDRLSLNLIKRQVDRVDKNVKDVKKDLRHVLELLKGGGSPEMSSTAPPAKPDMQPSQSVLRTVPEVLEPSSRPQSALRSTALQLDLSVPKQAGGVPKQAGGDFLPEELTGGSEQFTARGPAVKLDLCSELTSEIRSCTERVLQALNNTSLNYARPDDPGPKATPRSTPRTPRSARLPQSVVPQMPDGRLKQTQDIDSFDFQMEYLGVMRGEIKSSFAQLNFEVQSLQSRFTEQQARAASRIAPSTAKAAEVNGRPESSTMYEMSRM